MAPFCRLSHLVIAATLATASAAIVAQTRTPEPPPQRENAGDVLRLDAALDRLVAPGSRVEKLAGNLRRAEGPVWMRSGGYLVFSDLNEIMKWDPGSSLSVFRTRVFSGTAPAGVRVGTNGLTLDRQGRLVAVEHGNRRVSRFETNGETTVLADRYSGKRLNSPNDLVIKKSGEACFTDPPYFSRQSVSPESPEFRQELAFNGVYRLTNAGRVELLVKNLGSPNGLAFSPDETKLYVAKLPARENVDGLRRQPRWHARCGEGVHGRFRGCDRSGTDGIKVDTLGNLYATSPGGVLIISPEGKHLGTIRVPEIASNCAWGDADGKTLYVTARSGILWIKLNVAGVRP